MMVSPLYIKYQTTPDCHYLFDIATNEIVRVSSEIYGIIDDYGVLDTESIVTKHKTQYDEQVIRDALTALISLSKKGVLRPHVPHQHPKIIGLRLDGKTYSLDEFLNKFSRMLTLELTHRCNLNCEYCCFGKHYVRYRSHSTETMPKEIAEQAIRYHLDKPESGRSITFYGGEPLLEFLLLKHLVLYAEQYCCSIGKEPPRFALTTNGTLLTDEVCQFFVEHRFSVLVSLDGCQESHDQYRVFRHNGLGTFDIVRKNMLRFAELYPDFMGRGISLTLTADNNFSQTNLTIKELIPYYPTLIVNFVNTEVTPVKNDLSCECDQNSCVRPMEQTITENVPSFINWTSESLAHYRHCQQQFQELLFTSLEKARYEYPLFYKMFEGNHRKLHKRAIKYGQFSPKVACGCIPGAVRLYCSVHGDYFPCEKVETTQHLCIGNVENGIDFEKVNKMFGYLSTETDCDSCTGKYFCSICPNYITENFQGNIDNILIKKQCTELTRNVIDQLVTYTMIMEKQPSLLDIYKSETTGDDWLPHVQFVVSLSRSH
jgi:uncharacterized protein